MKIQSRKTVIITALIISIVMPLYVSAAPSAGIKPSSFFYFLDIASERVSLFFTFSSEKKVKKALEYADERLAEAEAVAGDKNTDAVKTAIANYESNLAFAAEKSKDIADKEKSAALLTTITDSTSRHQEVLTDVLIKVPDEAKYAITKAIEASRKGQEETMQKIAELKGEVEKLKQEVAELKAKDEERGKVIEELDKQKTESPSAQQKIPTPQTLNTPTTKSEPAKISIITLPNGAVVEIDAGGNIIRTIKEAIQIEVLEIISVSVNIPPEQNSAKLEWQTNKPTESKVFVSGGNLPSSKIFTSESGLSTRHFATIVGLARGFKFSYEIEAIAGGAIVVKKTGSFETEAPKPAKMKVLIGGYNLEDITSGKAPSPSIRGQGCGGSLNSDAMILDQYGESMSDQSVTFITPAGSLTKTITKENRLSNGMFGVRFFYYPITMDTTEKIAFTSGNFSAEAQIRIGHHFTTDDIGTKIIQQYDGRWFDIGLAKYVDIETMTCTQYGNIVS